MRLDIKTMRYSAALSSAVLTKGLLIYGAFRLGGYLDSRWHTAPLFLMLLIVAAVAVGIWWILKVAERNKP